jgi:hypothetical protein
MSNPVECRECEAILEELRDAFAETQAALKLTGELRIDGESIAKMLRGMDDDEVLAKFQFRAQPPESLREPASEYPRLRDVFRKMSEHHSRTGHVVLSLK